VQRLVKGRKNLCDFMLAHVFSPRKAFERTTERFRLNPQDFAAPKAVLDLEYKSIE
jgi:hypothetical protein